MAKLTRKNAIVVTQQMGPKGNGRDTRYSAKGPKGKWRYAQASKARLKCATYRR